MDDDDDAFDEGFDKAAAKSAIIKIALTHTTAFGKRRSEEPLSSPVRSSTSLIGCVCVDLFSFPLGMLSMLIWLQNRLLFLSGGMGVGRVICQS